MTIDELKIVNRALLLLLPSTGKKGLLASEALEIVSREIKAVEHLRAPDVLTAWGNLGKCSICGLAYDVCECIARR